MTTIDIQYFIYINFNNSIFFIDDKITLDLKKGKKDSIYIFPVLNLNV